MKSKTAALKILKKDWPARPAAIEKEEETKNRIWTATPALLRVYDSGNQEEMRNMIICRHLHIVLPDVNGGGGPHCGGREPPPYILLGIPKTKKFGCR